jgi:photosystem II stability/assembly factor-like uncharacterized protein
MKRTAFVLNIILLSCLRSGTPEPAWAQTPDPAYLSGPWVRLGGPPGGIGYDIRMRPDKPDTMVVTDSGGGIFKSIDGGRVWFPINEGIEASPGAGAPIFCATIDPHDHDVIWVGTQFNAHIYRSPDGGLTWEERDEGIVPFDGEHSVRGITVDPHDRDVVYAGLETSLDKSRGEVYKSTNGGMSWTRIWEGPNIARYVLVDPNNTERLYVSTGIFDRNADNSDLAGGVPGGVGILRSDDGGQTWTVLDEANGLGGLYIPSLFMHPGNPNVLLAAVTGQGGKSENAGAYVTRDGGDTWEATLPIGTAEAVEIAQDDHDVWYVASQGIFYRSDDAGQSWQEYRLRTADMEAGIPIDLQVDPRDSYRVFDNNYNGGNLISADGGATWRDASRGYSGAKVLGLAVLSDEALTILAGANTATFRSVDGGETWTGTGLGPTEKIIQFEEDQGATTHIVATGFDGYVLHSTDGGVTWDSTQVSPDGDFGEQTSRAFASAPSDPRTIYMGYAPRNCLNAEWPLCDDPSPGLFRSYDGGTTWDSVETAPFSNESIFDLAVHPTDADFVLVAAISGLHRSSDGGNTWEHLESLESVVPLFPGQGLPPVYSVAIDPFNPDVIYIGSPQGGVFVSRDKGESWSEARAGMDPNEPIIEILPEPNRAGVIYASSRFSGVFDSLDGAQTWQLLDDGFPQIASESLALSKDGSVLYAGTGVAGVFRLGSPGMVPVRMIFLEAEATEMGIRLSWEAAGEVDHLGFHVFRSLSPDRHESRITTELLRGDGKGTYLFEDLDVQDGQNYLYRIADVGRAGEMTFHGPVHVRYGGASDLTRPVLRANAPNPFTGETRIRFGLPRESSVSIRILSVDGRLVRTLVQHSPFPRGFHEVIWDGRDDSGRGVSGGFYIYTLETPRERLQRRMVFLR